MFALVLSAAMLAADTNHFVFCQTLPPPSDTTSRTVYGLVADPFTRVPLPAGLTGGVVEAVHAKMSIPDTMPIVVFDGHGQPTVAMTAAFSLAANGSAQNVAVMASSSSPAIDSMLIKGIEGAARDSSLPPLPPHAGNGIRLAFTLSTDSAAGSVPMFSIRVPQWRDFAGPRLTGKPDTLRASVVIDEKGVPLLGTVHTERIVPPTDLEWFRTARFVPGHIQRCAVRSLVSVRR